MEGTGRERRGWVQEISLRRANFVSERHEEPGRGNSSNSPSRRYLEKYLHFKYTVPYCHADLLEIHVSMVEFLEVGEVIVRH